MYRILGDSVKLWITHNEPVLCFLRGTIKKIVNGDKSGIKRPYLWNMVFLRLRIVFFG